MPLSYDLIQIHVYAFLFTHSNEQNYKIGIFKLILDVN